MAPLGPVVLVPRSLDDALRLRHENPGAAVIGGATIALQPEMPQAPVRIDLGGLGLDTVAARADGGLDLGAEARLGDLALRPELRAAGWGALHDVLDAFVPRAVRAVATVGGNVAFGGSLVGPLALLGARVRVRSLAGERTVPVETLAVALDELVVALELPPPTRFARTCSAVVRKTPVGPGLAVVALGEAPSGVEIVVSGGYTRPLRIDLPAGADVERTVREAVFAAAPHGGLCGDGPWRSAVAGVVARRLFDGTWQRPMVPAIAHTAPRFAVAPADGVLAFQAHVDGQPVAAQVPADATLTEALRLGGATQVKSSCGEGACGACSVLVAGHLVRSCLVPATRCNGLDIRTAAAPEHVELAAAIAEAGGLQCGYCTPGMVVALASLPDRSPSPAGHDVPWDATALARELDGNLCRCTGYGQLLQGAAAALNRRRDRAR